MASPNMVESEDLISKLPRLLKRVGHPFLGRNFKPLSFPYGKYNESGINGLNWLNTAKRGMLVMQRLWNQNTDLMVDVADIMQIRSRNMQNYPLIQDVASTKKPIMLKHHYGASLRD